MTRVIFEVLYLDAGRGLQRQKLSLVAMKPAAFSDCSTLIELRLPALVLNI